MTTQLPLWQEQSEIEQWAMSQLTTNGEFIRLNLVGSTPKYIAVFEVDCGHLHTMRSKNPMLCPLFIKDADFGVEWTGIIVSRGYFGVRRKESVISSDWAYIEILRMLGFPDYGQEYMVVHSPDEFPIGVPEWLLHNDNPVFEDATGYYCRHNAAWFINQYDGSKAMLEHYHPMGEMLGIAWFKYVEFRVGLMNARKVWMRHFAEWLFHNQFYVTDEFITQTEALIEECLNIPKGNKRLDYITTQARRILDEVPLSAYEFEEYGR